MKYQRDPTCGIFLKRGLFKNIFWVSHDCTRSSFKKLWKDLQNVLSLHLQKDSIKLTNRMFSKNPFWPFFFVRKDGYLTDWLCDRGLQWDSVWKLLFICNLSFELKCTMVIWISNWKLDGALKICWSSLRLFILYQSQRSASTFQWKVKQFVQNPINTSYVIGTRITSPSKRVFWWKFNKKDKCTFYPWIWDEKYFLWSKYIFLVWKAFIIISHSALPQSFCDNKFSAFWRQFHNRKGKLEAAGRSYIIYSCQTVPASSLRAAWSYIQIWLPHRR